MKKVFNMGRLREIDPGVANELDVHVERVVRDMHSRPSLDKARTVTLKLTFKPVMDILNDRPVLHEVKTDFNIKSSIPPSNSRVHTLMADRDRRGELIYQDMDHDNPRQGAFDDDGDESGDTDTPSTIPLRAGAGG